MTTTTLEDLDPALRSVGTAWAVTAAPDGTVAPRAGRLDGIRPRPTAGPRVPGRRRRPDRVGDLLPEAARQLGLEDELRLARADRHLGRPRRRARAAGRGRLPRSSALEPDALVVAVDEPIVAAELRMRALELLEAFAAAPGGARVRFLRIAGEAGRGAGDRRRPRV